MIELRREFREARLSERLLQHETKHDELFNALRELCAGISRLAAEVPQAQAQRLAPDVAEEQGMKLSQERASLRNELCALQSELRTENSKLGAQVP